MSRTLRLILGVSVAAIVFAVIYAPLTGRYSFATGIAPLALLVAVSSLILYVPVFLFLDSRRHLSSALYPIVIAIGLSIVFLLCLASIEWYGASATKATVTIDGGSTFIHGVPTDWWYQQTLRSLASAALASAAAGYLFWLTVRRGSENRA
jgi:hypothetical protein